MEPLPGSSADPLVADGSISQGTPGVPGNNETGDHFGAAVTFTYGTTCYNHFGLAIGVPGEDIGSVRDAGTVATVGLGSTSSQCPWRSIFRGSGLGGTLAAGDAVGSTLTTRLSAFRDTPDIADPLLIGAPGQTVNGQAGAGAVIETLQDSYNGPTTSAKTITATAGGSADSHYGADLTNPGGDAAL